MMRNKGTRLAVRWGLLVLAVLTPSLTVAQQVTNPGFESEGSGGVGDAASWQELSYAPPEVALGSPTTDPPGCSLAPYDDGASFRTFAQRSTSAYFGGSASMELRSSVNCGGPGQDTLPRPGIGAGERFRWRASAELSAVSVPLNPGTHVTFWTRMAGGIVCDVASSEPCLPFHCRSDNYDARNELGLLFDDGTTRTRVLTELHGPHAGLCNPNFGSASPSGGNGHVTQTVLGTNHHPLFDSANSSAPGRDGALWLRYTIPVPASYLGKTIRLGLVVDHFQNWASTGATGAYVDDVCLSDGSGICLDGDGDGIIDVNDNCADEPNPEQTDTDLDGDGDACDGDDDDDGVLDGIDNCQFTHNPGQLDLDQDGRGDACDADADGDGICEGSIPGFGCSGVNDNCPGSPNGFQTDTDLDGLGDECDDDDDNDGICDTSVEVSGVCAVGPDNCVTLVNPGQTDFDDDGIGDACDADVDGDGICEGPVTYVGTCALSNDNCPTTANSDQNDTDTDGDGDACDDDDDGDGVLDPDDNCPFIANLDQADTDMDGGGDACDHDLDGDGVANEADNCPGSSNSDQNDLDGDGLGDTCDPDIDGDGVENGGDLCPGTNPGAVIDPSNGCSIDQLCPCSGPRGTGVRWKNHGKYIACVAHAAEAFVQLGLMTEDAKDALVSEAASSSCGKP